VITTPQGGVPLNHRIDVKTLAIGNDGQRPVEVPAFQAKVPAGKDVRLQVCAAQQRHMLRAHIKGRLQVDEAGQLLRRVAGPRRSFSLEPVQAHGDIRVLHDLVKEHAAPGIVHRVRIQQKAIARMDRILLHALA